MDEYTYRASFIRVKGWVVEYGMDVSTVESMLEI